MLHAQVSYIGITTIGIKEMARKEIIIIGTMDNTKDHTFESANRIYGVGGVSPTIPTCAGGNIQPKVIRKIGESKAMNGQLDFDNIGNCNFEENQPKITAVKNNCGIKIDVADDLSLELEKSHYKDENEKTVEDYLYTDKNGDQWGIFKLTPRECGRLMNVSDDDIDKILSVNSNSQAYKQFGNSIVVSVLMAIFSQLNISGIKPWNDMTDDERYDLLTKGCVLGECVEEV